jgi:serine/threonine-protein kinase
MGDTSTGICPSCILRCAIEQGAGRALAPILPRLHYFGDYELLEEIARGGMGVVYRARQVSLERIVAVKMMRPGLLATEDEVRRFRAEAKTAAAMQHPNIVAIHEVGEFDGLHYFSMDFVDGPNLADLVRERPVDCAEAASHLRTLAAAVQYAHGRGILHRDLKPSNILLDSAGRPHITDFGLARPLDSDASVTMPGVVAGTPAYMSPEQAAGRHELLGPASDIYSLGAVLYELLTGRPPFHGRTQVETVNRVIGERPIPPRKFNATIPRAIEAICLRCLEKEPARRYGSAADLAADLDRFLEGSPVAARRRSNLRRLLIALAAVLLLGVVASVIRTNRPGTNFQGRPIEVKTVSVPVKQLRIRRISRNRIRMAGQFRRSPLLRLRADAPSPPKRRPQAQACPTAQPRPPQACLLQPRRPPASFLPRCPSR